MQPKLFKIRSRIWIIPVLFGDVIYLLLALASLSSGLIAELAVCAALTFIHFWAFKILLKAKRLEVQSPSWAGSINIISILFYLVFLSVILGVGTNVLMAILFFIGTVLYVFLVIVSVGLVLALDGFQYAKFISIPKAFFGWEADMIRYWVPNTHDRIPVIALTIIMGLLIIPTLVSILLVLFRKRINPAPVYMQN